MGTINSGLIMRALPRVPFDFSSIAAGSSITVPLVQNVNVGEFTEASFLVRVHTGTFGSGAQLQFQPALAGYDFGDPGVTPQFLTTVGSAVSVGSATTLPFFTVITVPSPFGRLISLLLTATTGAGGGTPSATISVDISLKGGDPTTLRLEPNHFLGHRIV